ncbi:collagen-binding domain-containing protein [Vibrio salinus]|uniref:collagen-binding domain-containing protein n=1 Tax=Vibrio salinus TaxID=2899784 RepID=UPI001E2F2BAB|nr:collagen-binding domain-containing protein [Vibrio salinus]MCE0494836.1 choice-of-anchor A family protein [Vibrio salinus]
MKTCQFVLMLTFCLVSFHTVASPIKLIRNYNLIVFDNLNSTSEVEGKTFVGGNLGGSASNYGTKLSTKNKSENALTIGGNLKAGTTVNINNGQNVLVGGHTNGTVNLNGGGSLINATSGHNFSQEQSELTSFSAYLSSLNSNSTLTAPFVCCSIASFDIGSINSDIAVFNISNSDFFGNKNIQQYDVNLNEESPAAIIINVSGTEINDSTFYANAVGEILSNALREKIIWNFYEAKTINLTKLLNGSLLAPYAHLTNWTPIEGSVVVNRFTQHGEVHLHSFEGHFPTKVPEPPTVIFLGLGLLALKVRRNIKPALKNNINISVTD